MTDSPFESLMALVDELVTAPALPEDAGDRIRLLLADGVTDGSIDPELHPDATTRWTLAVIAGARTTVDRDADPGAVDADLALLRVILTRWLHPARPRA